MLLYNATHSQKRLKISHFPASNTVYPKPAFQQEMIKEPETSQQLQYLLTAQ
jgi:hypothetical protein